jgi:S1-C subfamily serine protease
MVKEFLSQKGFQYEERDVSSSPTYAQEMIDRTGQRGVPVIIINGQVIVGFDRAKLEQALSNVSQSHSNFGTAIADTDKVKALFGTGITAGAYIGRVRAGSKAAEMELLPGDIVLEINRYRINNSADMESVVSRLRPGDRIAMVILRNGQTIAKEGSN